jgi:putative hydrolase of the HAD superfamily
MGEKVILFDLWGTLVENGTYSPMRQTYKALRPRLRFGDFVQKFEEAFMLQEYESQDEAFDAACKALNVESKKFITDKLIGLWNKNRLLSKMYQETLPVLEDLRTTHKVVIVSNSDCFVKSVIEKFELADKVDGIYLSCDTGKLKTDGSLILHALEQIGGSPEDALMVGDSIETDIKGAEKAGVRSVLIDRRDKREYDPKITNLTQVRGELDD